MISGPLEAPEGMIISGPLEAFGAASVLRTSSAKFNFQISHGIIEELLFFHA